MNNFKIGNKVTCYYSPEPIPYTMPIIVAITGDVTAIEGDILTVIENKNKEQFTFGWQACELIGDQE